MKHAKLIWHIKLFYCIFLICFIQILVGCIFASSSILLEQLRKPSSTIKLNIDEESWITSIPVLICPVGLITIGILTDVYGRIIALQYAYIPMILGWSILVFADSYTQIMIARTLLGIPLGVSVNLVLYVFEVCPVELRSTYSSMFTMNVGIGMLTEFVLSSFLGWRTVCGVLATAAVVNFVALFTLPESPMWLRSKGRAEEADRLDGAWFAAAGPPAAATGPPAVATGPPAVADHSAVAGDGPSYLSLYARRAVWKPATIALAFFACQQGTGVYVLMFYTADVVRNFNAPATSSPSTDSNAMATLVSVARVGGSLGFAALHALRRRTAVVVSAVGMAASLFAVLAYQKTYADAAPDPPLSALPVVALGAFMMFGMLGMLPMPWILSGEMFPMAVKGVMCGIVQTCGYIMWFISCKIYPSAVLTFGIEVVWSIFFSFCILSILFAIYIMPETHGKSLDEILSSLSTNKKTKKLDIS